MTKIDSNIPMPTQKPRATYPFLEMKVGDSFFTQGMENRNRVHVAAKYYAQRLGTKYSVRAYGDGIRCWRIK